jgi:hypothetical protein
MYVDHKPYFMSLGEAARTLNKGFVPVRIGHQVLEECSCVRDMTAEDRKKIESLAEDYADDI